MLRRLAKWKFYATIVIILITISMQQGDGAIQPLGSILFEDHGYPKKCFVQNDIAQLATRLKLQNLLPCEVELMDDEGILAMIKYFYGVNEIIDHMSGNEARQLVEKCFYDMLGGYLKHIILPITKFSFYAGNVTFSVAQNVFSLYDRCKELLDTNGNSWSEPITDFSQFSINILPLSISKATSDDESMKTCSNLAMNQNDEDNDEDMLVALPKIETSQDENLSTIWLPLKRKHIFNIHSKTSAFILFRYYVTVTQCYRYQGINQSIFNRKLKLWISENVIPYLDDDQLYPAFGAVLRIMESIRDQNDGRYEGSKAKKPKKSREDIIDLIHSDLESKFPNFSIGSTRDVYWWLYAVLAAGVLTFLIILIIFLCCRFCFKKTSNDGDGKSPSLTQKISSVLKRNTHTPEHDEFYAYKKLSHEDQQPSRQKKGIKFENEKSRKNNLLKKIKSKKNEKIKLPNLNMSGSEDDIVIHETRKFSLPSSTSSLNSIRQKPKTSADTDDIAEMAARNLTRNSGFLTRMRSPLRKNRNKSDDT